MQETINNAILNEIRDKKGYFIVKIPKSKCMLLCTCNIDWNIKILNPDFTESETVKESIKSDQLSKFIDNILKINKKDITMKEIKNTINKTK